MPNPTAPTSSPLSWYPMRVTYGREMSIKSYLDELGVENFLPLQYQTVEHNDTRSRKLLPAVRNLIFVHSSKEVITRLKHEYARIEPLLYMTRTLRSENGRKEILVVPDDQMQNFMRVAAVQDERVLYLKKGDYLNKVGKKVRIIDGLFTGVEGKILRINKNKKVVVELEDIVSVAVAFVPSQFIVERQEEES